MTFTHAIVIYAPDPELPEYHRPLYATIILDSVRTETGWTVSWQVKDASGARTFEQHGGFATIDEAITDAACALGGRSASNNERPDATG